MRRRDPLLLRSPLPPPAPPPYYRRQIIVREDKRQFFLRLRRRKPILRQGHGGLVGVVVTAPPRHPSLTPVIEVRAALTSVLETRATLASSTATRGSLGGEQGYGSAIPDNSPWSLPDFMIPDDEDTTDWMRDEDDLTPSPPTRATLTPA